MMNRFVPNAMQVRDLLAAIGEDYSGLNTTITGISLDSRTVQTGDLFVALKGHKLNGQEFIPAAISRGAAAVLVESPLPESLSEQVVPVIAVTDLTQKLSVIAGRFFANPSEKLNLIGVTGTNGKSTCVHLMAQLAQGLGRKSASIGTLGVFCENQMQIDYAMTTPDAIACQKTLADLRANDVSTVAMEVSSHGLAQCRVSGLNFRAAIFTNISHDHLDYHGDIDSYAKAKSVLFAMPQLQFAIINKDDSFSALIAGATNSAANANTKVLFYSLKDTGADVYVSGVKVSNGQTYFHLKSPWGEADVRSPLLGEFNIYNLVAVFTTLCAQGASFEHAVNLCASVTPVPGRMQHVQNTQLGLTVVVDYAHTPDALSKALTALKAHTQNKLWCVFGCGGDRDTTKRAPMAKVAEGLADYVVVTSDNPRSENPTAIIDEICQGFVDIEPIVEVERSRAIQYAVANANAGDAILLAGKGHEQYQIVGDTKLHFSDMECANEALDLRAKSQAAGGIQ